MSLLKIHEKFHGIIFGLAVGDVMGLALKFSDPGTLKPLNDIIGGGPFHLDPGMGDS